MSSPEAFGFSCALAKPYGIAELMAVVDKTLARGEGAD
jgi:hypothetical protein